MIPVLASRFTHAGVCGRVAFKVGGCFAVIGGDDGVDLPVDGRGTGGRGKRHERALLLVEHFAPLTELLHADHFPRPHAARRRFGRHFRSITNHNSFVIDTIFLLTTVFLFRSDTHYDFTGNIAPIKRTRLRCKLDNKGGPVGGAGRAGRDIMMSDQ